MIITEQTDTILSDSCENWNSLPENIVGATSLNILKIKLDRHLRENWGLK